MFDQTSISWLSKLQKTVAISSCEAEYIALKNAVQEMFWLQSIFKQLSVLKIYNIKKLYCDNKSAIDLSKNSEYHARTKHIDIQYHFVCDYIERETIELKYVCTKKQLADALTKTIDINSFRSFCKKINLVDL